MTPITPHAYRSGFCVAKVLDFDKNEKVLMNFLDCVFDMTAINL
jgi:hypothetical protein